MLSAEKKNSKSNDWNAQKQGLVLELHKAFNVAHGYWDFARDGGALGDYSLKDKEGNLLTLPANALVLNAFAVVETLVTSGGALTLDLQVEGANDLIAAAALGSLTAGAKLQGIPDFGTLADSILTTTERTAKVSLNVAAATAGKVHAFIFYVQAHG